MLLRVLISCLLLQLAWSQPLINEFGPLRKEGPPFEPPEMVQTELYGVPGTSFNGYLSAIQSTDPGGRIETATFINDVFDANGLLLVDIPNTNFRIELYALILSSDFSDTANTTLLDSDNDGLVDDTIPSVFGTIYDFISLSTDFNSYAKQLQGFELPYSIIGSSSISFNFFDDFFFFRDSTTRQIWLINTDSMVAFDAALLPAPFSDFDSGNLTGVPTFGSTNPTTGPGSTLFIISEDFKFEGNSGTTTTFNFRVIRNVGRSQAASIEFLVSGGDADAADFVGGSLPLGTLSFNANEISKVLTINVAGDDTEENNESFMLSVSDDSFATSASTMGVIQDDDTSAPLQAFINEYEVIPTNYLSRTSFAVELRGIPNTAFAGWLLVCRERTGRVMSATLVSGTFDADGILLATIFATTKFYFLALTYSFIGVLGRTSLKIAIDDALGLGFNTFGSIFDVTGSVQFFSIAYEYPTQLGGNAFADVNFEQPGLVFRDANTLKWWGIYPSGNASQVYNIAGDPTPFSSFNVADPSSPTFGSVNPSTATSSSSLYISPEYVIRIERDERRITGFMFRVIRNTNFGLSSGVQYRATGGAVAPFDFIGNPANGGDFVGGSFPEGTVNILANQISNTFPISVNGDGENEEDEAFVVSVSEDSFTTSATAQVIIKNDDFRTFLSPCGRDEVCGLLPIYIPLRYSVSARIFTSCINLCVTGFAYSFLRFFGFVCGSGCGVE